MDLLLLWWAQPSLDFVFTFAVLFKLFWTIIQFILSPSKSSVCQYSYRCGYFRYFLSEELNTKLVSYEASVLISLIIYILPKKPLNVGWYLWYLVERTKTWDSPRPICGCSWLLKESGYLITNGVWIHLNKVSNFIIVCSPTDL